LQRSDALAFSLGLEFEETVGLPVHVVATFLNASPRPRVGRSTDINSNYRRATSIGRRR